MLQFMEILFMFLTLGIIKLKSTHQMALFLKSFDYNFAGANVRPGGLIADPNGDIYFVDAVKYRVVKMNSDGKTITTWGNIGIGNGKFLEPKDLVLDNLGYLYVLDSAQGLIQKFETPVVAQIEEALTAEQFRKLQELSYAEATAGSRS